MPDCPPPPLTWDGQNALKELDPFVVEVADSMADSKADSTADSMTDSLADSTADSVAEWAADLKEEAPAVGPLDWLEDPQATQVPSLSASTIARIHHHYST